VLGEGPGEVGERKALKARGAPSGGYLHSMVRTIRMLLLTAVEKEKKRFNQKSLVQGNCTNFHKSAEKKQEGGGK